MNEPRHTKADCFMSIGEVDAKIEELQDLRAALIVQDGHPSFLTWLDPKEAAEAIKAYDSAEARLRDASKKRVDRVDALLKSRDTSIVEQDCLSLTALKKRGWSDGLISDLLGSPDKSARNPHLKSGASIKLFSVARVEAAESDERFIRHQERRPKMRAAAIESAERRRHELFAAVAAVKIDVPRMPIDELFVLATNHWQDRHMDRGFFFDGSDADEETKKRWARNYLRHILTPYESIAASMFGAVGRQDGHALLKEKINDAILAAYPELRSA